MLNIFGFHGLHSEKQQQQHAVTVFNLPCSKLVSSEFYKHLDKWFILGALSSYGRSFRFVPNNTINSIWNSLTYDLIV